MNFIEQEITPYKIDFYNYLKSQTDLEFTVFFSRRRDLASDAGHRYDSFPLILFPHEMSKASEANAVEVFCFFLKTKSKNIIISGLNIKPLKIAVILSFFMRKRIFLVVDAFSSGRGVLVKSAILRFLAKGVLTPRGTGFASASLLGFRSCEIYDYCYAVDRKRIEKHLTNYHRYSANSSIKIFYSGRLIPRKGLFDLLAAYDLLCDEYPCIVLSVEGDGPDRRAVESEIAKLNSKNGRTIEFLGFQDYEEHTQALCAADVVVVPSYQDNWGLVVYEGLLAEKTVVASTGVNSAVSLIHDGSNGLIYEGGSVAGLVRVLSRVLEGWTPEIGPVVDYNVRNREALEAIVRRYGDAN